MLGAVAAILLRPRPRVLLLAVGLGGLVIALIVAFATRIDPDECFGECVEIAGRGYDPFILVFALINFLGGCLGLIIGRILRPLVLSTP